MTIRSTDSNSQGFTLAEMLIVIAIVGILMGLAAPSLLTLDKPLREGTSQFKSQLNLIRAKAIASNQAYRLRPKYPTSSEYSGQGPNSFIVEYAANCQITRYGTSPTPAVSPNGWQRASQLDLDFPSTVGVSGTATATIKDTPQTPTPDANLNWSICFDNRGIAYQPVTFTLKDFRGNNRAQTAEISVPAIGAVAIKTQDSAGADISAVNGNPVF